MVRDSFKSPRDDCCKPSENVGPREAFRTWRTALPNRREDVPGAEEITTIEQVAAPTVRDKIKGKLPKSGEIVFDVLHAEFSFQSGRVLSQFREYLESIGLEQKLAYQFFAGGVCFVEPDATVELAEQIATFSPIRALRQMPTLRMLRSSFRFSRVPMQNIQLPTEGPIDPGIRVAIFDGGIPKGHPINKWAKPIEAQGVGKSISLFQKHGVAVTSSFLFGHIDPTKPISRPYATVDPYRVLDATPGQDPHEFYEVLGRIDKILVEKGLRLHNLCIGPKWPIEDNDVHASTAVLDDRLSRGTTLAAIAVGNDGEQDAHSGPGGLRQGAGGRRLRQPGDALAALRLQLRRPRQPRTHQAGLRRIRWLSAARVHRVE